MFVALKLIPKAGRSPAALDGLRDELRLLRGLTSPHVIALLDAFETPDDLVIVTEAAITELWAVLADEPRGLPEPHAALVALQLLRALAHVHSRRVMHRDLKPQNILVCAPARLAVPAPGGGSVEVVAPRVALADFGLAAALAPAEQLLSSFKGSPLYMAPEMFRERAYTLAADVWAAGAIVYELLTGRPLWRAQTLAELVDEVNASAPGGSSAGAGRGGAMDFPPELSAAARDFLAAALTRDARARPTAQALLRHPWLQRAVEAAILDAAV